MKKNKQTLELGDRVAYSATFLRAIGDYSYESASMRAHVIGFEPLGGNRLARLKWNDGSDRSVLESNLRRVDDLHKEAV